MSGAEELRRCIPGLSPAQVEALAPHVGPDLRLERGDDGGVQVTIRTDRGQEVFRSIPAELRIPLEVTGVFDSLYAAPGCPRCDARMRGSRCTISPTEVVRDLWCPGCSWSQAERGGTPTSLAYTREDVAPAPPALTNAGRPLWVRLDLEDTLAFFQPGLGAHTADPAQKKSTVWWFRVPASWLAEGELREPALERVLEHLYGAGWQSGNADGSRYRVLSTATRRPTPAERRARPWRKAGYAWGGAAFAKVRRS